MHKNLLVLHQRRTGAGIIPAIPSVFGTFGTNAGIPAPIAAFVPVGTIDAAITEGN